MESFEVMESTFKVGAWKRPQLLAYVANTLFEQNWIVEEDSKCTSKKGQTTKDWDTMQKAKKRNQSTRLYVTI